MADSIRIERSEIDAIFVAFGFVNAKKWSDEKMIKRIKTKLPSYYVSERDKLTEKQFALAKEIVLSRAKKLPIVLVSGKASAGAKTASPKPTGEKEKTVKTKIKEKSSKDKKNKKEDKKPKKSAGVQRVGIIDYVEELARKSTKNNPITVDATIKACKKKWPDREESSLRNTITSQLSSQLRAKRGLNLKKLPGRGAGYFLSKKAA